MVSDIGQRIVKPLGRPHYQSQRIATHVDDVGHVLAMGMLAEVRGCANDNIEAINACLHSQTGIVHVAADVGQDLGLEAELADRLAILS
jgi:hypothetical protein